MSTMHPTSDQRKTENLPLDATGAVNVEIVEQNIRIAELESLRTADEVTIASLNARLPEFARLHAENRALKEAIREWAEADDALRCAERATKWEKARKRLACARATLLEKAAQERAK